MNFLENVDILGFFIAVVTLIVTSWQQRKSVQNQALESSIRATLSDFTDLRRVHQECFDKAFSGGTLQNKKEYVADLERFAVGVNQGAYHLQTLSRMSGGRLIKQWKSWVRDFISERRLNCSLYAMTPPDRFYTECEEMMRRLFDLHARNDWEPALKVSRELNALHAFLSMPIASTDDVFAPFRQMDNVVEAHDGKRGYLYAPGTRSDRCVLVAHADTYFDDEYSKESGHFTNKLLFDGGVYRGESGNCSIGADDRAGCAMLWLLRDSGHSLLILDGEEHGQLGAHYLKETNPSLYNELNSHTCMLELDRRGNSDYKCYDLPVSIEFREWIESRTGFTSVTGKGRTDIIVLCRDICGANLSVGYYNEHQSKEYVSVEDWQNSLDKVMAMITQPIKEFPLL